MDIFDFIRSIPLKELLNYLPKSLDFRLVNNAFGLNIIITIALLAAYSLTNIMYRFFQIQREQRILWKIKKNWEKWFEADPSSDNIHSLLDQISFKGEVAASIKRQKQLWKRNANFNHDVFFSSISFKFEKRLQSVRWIISILTILGLLGTVIGLQEAISGLRLDASDTSARDQLDQMIKLTMSGLVTAFTTTIYGLGGTILLTLFMLFYGKYQNLFLTMFDRFLQEEIEPYLFPSPNALMQLSYQKMTEEFGKTQQTLKMSFTEFILELRNVAKDLTNSYATTFEKLREQFEMLNTITANMTKELSDNYTNTQSNLRIILAISEKFETGTRNLNESHSFIKENYEKLFEEQQRLERFHQEQLQKLTTHSEQLTSTLVIVQGTANRMNELTNRLTDLSASIESLSRSTEAERKLLHEEQRSLFLEFTTQQKQEYQNWSTLHGQLMSDLPSQISQAIRDAGSDYQKQLDQVAHRMELITTELAQISEHVTTQSLEIQKQWETTRQILEDFSNEMARSVKSGMTENFERLETQFLSTVSESLAAVSRSHRESMEKLEEGMDRINQEIRSCLLDMTQELKSTIEESEEKYERVIEAMTTTLKESVNQVSHSVEKTTTDSAKYFEQLIQLSKESIPQVSISLKTAIDNSDKNHSRMIQEIKESLDSYLVSQKNASENADKNHAAMVQEIKELSGKNGTIGQKFDLLLTDSQKMIEKIELFLKLIRAAQHPIAETPWHSPPPGQSAIRRESTMESDSVPKDKTNPIPEVTLVPPGQTQNKTEKKTSTLLNDILKLGRK